MTVPLRARLATARAQDAEPELDPAVELEVDAAA